MITDCNNELSKSGLFGFIKDEILQGCKKASRYKNGSLF